MTVRVMMADDSECMLAALRQVLAEEAQIEIAGETNSFTATLAKMADSNPDVLVLDLHLPECAEYGSEVVREKLAGLKRIVAISFSNDEEAKSLAQSYGAAILLDKMNLYTELIPAILKPGDAVTNAETTASKASAASSGR
jgi:DNA-binding NarL/FixJ family response regulator